MWMVLTIVVTFGTRMQWTSVSYLHMIHPACAGLLGADSLQASLWVALDILKFWFCILGCDTTCVLFMNVSIPVPWNEWHPHFGRPIKSTHVWSVFLNKLTSPTWFYFLNMCLFALLLSKLFCRKANGKMGQVLTNYLTETSYHRIKHLVPKAPSQVSST